MSEPNITTTPGQASSQTSRRSTVALIAITLLVLVFLVLRYFVFQVAEVQGQGMQPLLQKGDQVLVNRLANDFKVGQLVVFTRKDKFFVRRVVAVDGDRVSVQGGIVHHDGRPAAIETRQALDYLDAQGATRTCSRTREQIGANSWQICLGEPVSGRTLAQEAVEVPMGSFFVLCDNRVDCPDDSLTLGLVRKGAIRGRVTHLIARQGRSEGLASIFGLWEEL